MVPSSADTATTGTTTTSTGGGGGGEAPTGCETNQECIDENAGLPSVCRAGDCIPILSEDCTQVINEEGISGENPFILGFLAPLTGPASAGGIRYLSGSVLAIDEIDKVAKGLPLGTGSRRPVSLVACDEYVDANRAIRHLDALGVTGVIGPNYSKTMLEIATEFTIPEDILLLSLVTSPSLLDLADDGLIWSLLPNSADEVPAIAQVVEEVEAKVRADRSLAPTDPVKLAMLVRSDDSGTRLADLATAVVTVNGALVGDSSNDDFFLRRDHENPADFPDSEPDYADDINAMLDFEPDIIILLGGTEGMLRISSAMEEEWPDGVPRPEYVASSTAVNPEVGIVVGSTFDAWQRFRALRPLDANGEEYDNFKLRYRAANGNTFPPPDTENTYDAVYLLAYAALAAGNVPTLDGPALANGLAKLTPGGTSYRVGPTNMSDIINVLVAGGDIDLEGASSSLDFDPSTGVITDELIVTCITAPPGTAEVPAGQTYDPETGALTGSFACPE